LCQLNRDVEKRVPPFPMLSDLRDSGSLEQDADKVIMLYREDYYFPKGQEVKDKKTKITTYSGPTGICDVIIAKNKNGRTGTIKTIFDENTMNFKSISEQTEDYSSFLKE
jgi:replicative DNA helicase